MNTCHGGWATTGKGTAVGDGGVLHQGPPPRTSEYLKGGHTADQHIEPEVKFEAIQEKRVVDVPSMKEVVRHMKGLLGTHG